MLLYVTNNIFESKTKKHYKFYMKKLSIQEEAIMQKVWKLKKMYGNRDSKGTP